jgi:hypothetical protein
MVIMAMMAASIDGSIDMRLWLQRGTAGMMQSQDAARQAKDSVGVTEIHVGK